MNTDTKTTKINWRERLIAAAIHFLLTLCVAGLAAALIFLVWFPGALAEMAGGTKLFRMVVGIDLALGPLISLVIYNSAKPKRELIADYSIVALVQLAALIYGVWVVAASRPVFVAFALDRYEIVAAIELDDADIAAANPEFRSKSWWGPRYVFMQQPGDEKERQAMLDSALAGKDGYLMPKYYRDFDSGRPLALAKSAALEDLLKGSGTAARSIEAAVANTGKSQAELRWLLVHHRFGFGIALIDSQTALPLQYIAMDPTWLDKK